MARSPWLYLMALGSALAAGSAAAENLLDICSLAFKHDPQLRQAEAAFLEAQEAKPQARAGLLPSINFSANIFRNRQEIEQGGVGGDATLSFTTKGYSVSLSQPVYRRERFVALRQADASVQAAAARLEAVRQALVLTAALRYFEVLRAVDDLEFARANKAAIARQLEQSQQRFEVGLIAITDVQEAQSRYDLAVSQEIDAENRLAIQQEFLRALTGTYVGALAPLGPDLPLLPPEPADADQWTQQALEENLGILAARYSSEAAEEGIELQRSARYPAVDLVADHTYSDIGGGIQGDRELTESTVGLQLSVPLYTGGLINSRG